MCGCGYLGFALERIFRHFHVVSRIMFEQFENTSHAFEQDNLNADVPTVQHFV